MHSLTNMTSLSQSDVNISGLFLEDESEDDDDDILITVVVVVVVVMDVLLKRNI